MERCANSDTLYELLVQTPFFTALDLQGEDIVDLCSEMSVRKLKPQYPDLSYDEVFFVLSGKVKKTVSEQNAQILREHMLRKRRINLDFKVAVSHIEPFSFDEETSNHKGYILTAENGAIIIFTTKLYYDKLKGKLLHDPSDPKINFIQKSFNHSITRFKIIQNIKLFSVLSLQRYAYLFHQGEVANCFYLVCYGFIDVERYYVGCLSKQRATTRKHS